MLFVYRRDDQHAIWFLVFGEVVEVGVLVVGVFHIVVVMGDRHGFYDGYVVELFEQLLLLLRENFHGARTLVIYWPLS